MLSLTAPHAPRWLLYASLVLLTRCGHGKQNDPAPVNQLPPATQTGANTFGCLVNGKAYIPQGNNGTPNFVLLYEPGVQKSGFNILTYRKDGGYQDMNLYCGWAMPLQKHTFAIGLPVVEASGWYTGPAGDFDNDGGLKYRHGQLVITRLDEQAGVIAGTFEFTSVNTKGDTLKVTQGRFDSKL